MTNNTIPNVPRELTIERDVFGAMHIKLGDFDFIQIQYQHPYTDNASTKTLAERIAAILSAPSPAGVDGLGNTAKLLLPALRQYMHNDGSGLLAGYDLETTQAIIDGLRAENETLRKRAKTAEREAGSALKTYKGLEKVARVVSDNSDQVCGELNVMRQERDQQAQRIGELEGLLTAERNKVPLYEAVERACGDLPEGWKVELHMENGAGWIELYDPEGIEVENFPTNNERLDYTINDATDAALSAGKDSDQ